MRFTSLLAAQKTIPFRSYGISVLIGLLSGVVVALFLNALAAITQFRINHPTLIYGLPLVGLLIPFLYKQYGFGIERGLPSILEEIHNPRQVLPWTMAPLIFVCTLLTHLVGGSAGREGTALQMATSLADRTADFFRVPLLQRRWVLMAGLSGGFSAALGAPWAGMVFGLEVLTVNRRDRINSNQITECFLASFFAWFISLGLNAPHFAPRTLNIPTFSLHLFYHLMLLGLIIGLTARLHTHGVSWLEQKTKLLPASYRTALGGFLLLGIYLAFPLHAFQGLGLESIQHAFESAPQVETPWIKGGLTLITLAFGFKGGEFVPLVFMGTTLSSFWAQQWNESIPLFAALGFVSLFGAAAKTPWTCAFLALDIFGWQSVPFAILVLFIARWIAGSKGIYSNSAIINNNPINNH